MNFTTDSRCRRLDIRRHGSLLKVFATAFLVLTVSFDAAAASAGGSSQNGVNPASHSGTVGFRNEAISPDGRRVIWVSGSGIYVTEVPPFASSEPRKITDGDSPVWSPDGKQIAYLAAEGDSRHKNIYVVKSSGGKPTRLTNLTGSLANPRWSPDGKSLGFLLVENAPQPDPLYPVPPPTGVVGEHWLEQRLAVVDLATQHLRVVSPSDLYIYEFDFSPDGTKAAAAGVKGPPNDNWFISHVYVIDLASGAAQSILNPGVQIAIPQWSPDGQKIAFLGGLMSGHAGRSGDIWVISSNGDKVEDLTEGLRFSSRSFAWASPSRIVITQLIHGDSALAEIDVPSHKVSQLWTSNGFSSEGAGVGSSNYEVSLSKDGHSIVAAVDSFDRPPEIWAGPLGSWKQITHANEGLQPTWGKVVSVDWQSDGWKVQGWLYFPVQFDPQKRYPLVVEVHGGPAYLVKPHWGDADDLSSAGYFVLAPNYVGSAGEGEPFKRGIVRDYGYADLTSITAGVNKVLGKYPIDRNRIGITGWSNGGYMAMWAVTQTDLFHAAVPGAGIADWLSYYGQNDIDQWAIPYFGASAYDDPLIYARSSPMTFIKNVKTPTLILVGEDDAECPAAQSLQFWHALRTLGVPTQLVIYPGEGHSFTKPEDNRDVAERRLEWFNRYLK
jgi:dipeptidyl aminopeptidase/acylaminoacyl peptidase